MDDPIMKWLTYLLGALVLVLVVAIFMLASNPNIVCEINPYDATDVFCYEPE